MNVEIFSHHDIMANTVFELSFEAQPEKGCKVIHRALSHDLNPTWFALPIINTLVILCDVRNIHTQGRWCDKQEVSGAGAGPEASCFAIQNRGVESTKNL